MRPFITGRTVPYTLMSMSAAWCILATAAIYGWPSAFESVNWRIYDWKMAFFARPEPSSDIVHVDVDDRALADKTYGPWPWSRAVSGRIVQRLSEMGAKAIVFDVLYTAPGRVPEEDEFFFESMRKAGNVVSATGLGVAALPGSIRQFAGDPCRMDALYEKSWTVSEPDAPDLPSAWRLTDSLIPLQQVIEASREVGHIKSTPDRDGVHRRVPLFVRLEKRFVPSLALAALSASGQLKPDDLAFEKKDRLHMRLLGKEIDVPVDSRGMMLLNWAEPWGGFKHYSVTDVLSDVPDQARAQRYRDKIVIVAVTGTGSTDIGPTPVSPEFPLSRISSHAISTILTGQFIHAVVPFPLLVGVAWLVAILFSLAAPRLSLRNAIIAGSCLWVVSLIVPLTCFSVFSYEVPLAEYLTLVIPSTSIALISMVVTREFVADRTSTALKKYLSPDLVDRILTGRGELDLSTKRKELTVLFADIEDFSHISETVDVDYLTRFLNEFFDTMTRVIFTHQGTVDKFLGDGILAFFGDPVLLENHALSAVRAAVDIQKEMAALSSRWTQVGVPEFQQGLRIRIGVSTGIVVVGNIGSARRMEYTVVGSEINVASKIQSKAPTGSILITSRTHALTRHTIPCQGPETVKVKGTDRPVEVYLVDPGLVREGIGSSER
jgi:adenylate cyclase